MAPTHGVYGRNAIANAIKAAVEGGSGPGLLNLYTVADAPLVSITLDATAFGPASSGIITLNGVPITGIASGSGIVAKFSVTDADSTVVYQGTAGESATDLIIDNATLVASQNVVVTSHSYSASN